MFSVLACLRHFNFPERFLQLQKLVNLTYVEEVFDLQITWIIKRQIKTLVNFIPAVAEDVFDCEANFRNSKNNLCNKV